MKISKISIKNYRSCEATTFSPDDELTVLIGPNGSGKTNILSAIRLLTSLLFVSRRSQMRRQEDIIFSESEIKTWFDLNGKTVIHTAKVSLVVNERNEDEIISSNENWYMFDITGSRKKANIPLAMLSEISHLDEVRIYRGTRDRAFFMRRYLVDRDFDEKALTAMTSIANYISSIGYYSASQFTNPSNCPISFEVEEGGPGFRRGISIRSSHKEFLYDMYSEYKEKTDAYQDFFDIVGPSGIGLVDNINFNEVKTSSSRVSVHTGGAVKTREKINLMVVPGFTISDSTLSPSQLSEGTFKTLALIFHLITDKSSMLMIEEPEVCVHHGLLNSIIELINIYSKEKQILISTHSDTVLDRVEIKNVFAVKRASLKGTIVTNISKSMKNIEMRALKDYLETEGSLGELWKHGDLENV
jgi:AAA15 family ATPase/GTPase